MALSRCACGKIPHTLLSSRTPGLGQFGVGSEDLHSGFYDTLGGIGLGCGDREEFCIMSLNAGDV